MQQVKNDPDYYRFLISKPTDKLTLAEIAEMWSYETSGHMPAQNTPEWEAMFEKWVTECFGKEK